MKFDYRLLNAFIEVYGGVDAVAKAADIKPARLRKELEERQGKLSVVEVEWLRRALDIPVELIDLVFYKWEGEKITEG